MRLSSLRDSLDGDVVEPLEYQNEQNQRFSPRTYVGVKEYAWLLHTRDPDDDVINIDMG